jgi:hypothetical protein
MEGPGGVAFTQLVDARTFTFGSDADQYAYRFAVPPFRRLAPPGEYFQYPVEALAPDEGSRLELLVDMYGYRLVDIFGHLTTPFL